MTLVTGNILDPISDKLDPTVWEKPDSDMPILRPAHAHWITSTIYDVLENGGYSHPERWLDLVLTGSLTTYQYSADSDCDVSLFINASKLPEWSRAEMIGLMIDGFDERNLPGTSHPMQCYVVAKGVHPADLYKKGLRAGYDIKKHHWIEPPDHDREHDVEAVENGFWEYAKEQADKMERLLRYEPEKAVTFWRQIHKRRMHDQSAGKGDFAESNIVYKFLNNRGLFPQVAALTGEHVGALKEAGVAPWEPGQFGKGIIMPNGRPLAWKTQSEDGYGDEDYRDFGPHHGDITTKMGLGRFGREAKGFAWVLPDGAFAVQPGNGMTNDEAHQAFAQFHPALHHDQEFLWDDPTAVMQRFGAIDDHQSLLDNNAGQDLQGLPGPANVPGIGPLQFHSNGDIQRIANEYNQQRGLNPHPTDYMPVNPDNAAAIAQEYEAMPHDPNHPRVQEAYSALTNEVRQQYDAAVKNGYRFEFYPQGEDPYPSSPRQAVLDLHRNKHMYVYPTEQGYGQEGQDPQDHPLLGDSGVRWQGQPVTHNDLFRAIHDFYGHAKEGLGFRAQGEDNAYRQHQAMFSPAARQALASETRGQNSWVNYGPYGEHNQTAGQADTVFAPQKAGLMPEWTTDPNLHAPQPAMVTSMWKVGSPQAQHVYEQTVQNGGITVGLDGSQPDQGFAFSIQQENEEKVPVDKFTPEVVDDYLQRHHDDLSHPGRYLGTWESDGLIYMDVSQVEQDQQTAHGMAQNANQLAMYDLSNFNEIPIQRDTL